MKNICFVLTGLFIAGCKGPGYNRETVQQETRKMMQEYYLERKLSGLAAELLYLDTSADFSWIPPGHCTPLSYDSVTAIIYRTAPLYQSINDSIEQLHITPLNTELAQYTALLHSEMTDTAGHTSLSRLAESGILVRRKDGWKILCGHTTQCTP